MLISIVVIVLVIVAVILLLAMTKPGSFRVERTEVIGAPPEDIFPLLNDFHRWSAWSPWEKLDPSMKRSFSGAPSGVGSVYEWDGNKKAGQGRMEITDSQPWSHIGINLDFLKPFKAHNITEFDLHQHGGGTELKWAMHGPSPFMTKLMMVFTTMDKLVGKDFDEGMANLKRVAEAGSAR